MFAITATFDNHPQYLDVNNGRWYSYYHYGCLRRNRETLEHYIAKEKADITATIVPKPTSEYGIETLVAHNKDKVAKYFELLKSEIIEITDYDRKWDFTFITANNHFWSRKERTQHCIICGIKIPSGMLFVGASEDYKDKIICPFCVRDAHQQAVDEISNIPKEILERVEAIRGEQLLIKNL